MNRFIKKITAAAVVMALLTAALSGCGNAAAPQNSNRGNSSIVYENEVKIVLSDDEITVNGTPVGNSSQEAVFISHDIIYYEDRDSYESGNPYGEGTDADKHTAEEAAAAKVVNITQAGIYRLSGSLSEGQIRIDLGEDAKEDENAVVTLVLDGVDINCSVAPAVIFMNVYECDNNWSTETAQSVVDTSAAGANVIIADGSKNNVNGSYVARIYKDNEEEKKLWKQDGAFYSYMSMNVNGETENTGVLNINAENEGLDSELHLTINGGNINIFAGNDGINTNEDGVSVTTINGGNIHIVAGLGEEGDGIDSNGWLVINGGNVVATANPAADAGMDSDLGSFINGGTVVALGSTMDWAESDSEQVTMNLQFAQYRESDEALIVTDTEGNTVFCYDPSEDEVVGSNIRKYMGAVISCPAFKTDSEYNVYIGGEVMGSENGGIYDTATVTGFENATQQQYTSSDVKMGPGGMGGFGGGMMGERPEGFDPAEFGGEKPEGFDPAEFGGERPEGFDPAEFGGEIPEGFDPAEFGGEKPKGFENYADSQKDIARTAFFMQDKVNNFSGITDVTQTEQ